MKETVRWALTVTRDTDRRVRRVLEAANRRGELSQFVEETIKSRLLELTVQTQHRRPSANEVVTNQVESADPERLSHGG